MSGEIKLLANSFEMVATNDMVIDGSTITAGTRVILVPVTTSRAVMHGEHSLEDLWSTLSKTNHTHSSASISAAGFMSAADKSKLNNLPVIGYGVCSTSAATPAKTVTVNGFELTTGSRVIVKFENTNSADNPTLNVNDTGDKAIYYKGASIDAAYLAANSTMEFVYNGTQYELIGEIDTWSLLLSQMQNNLVTFMDRVTQLETYATQSLNYPGYVDANNNNN